MSIDTLKKELRGKASRLKELIGKDSVSDEERKEKRNLLNECTALKSEIEEREEEIRAFDELDRSYVTPPDGPLAGQGPIETERRGGPAKDKTYRGMFGDDLDRGNFKDPEEFLTIVHSGRYDQRLVKAQAEKRDIMIEGTGVDGGFSVPTEFAAKWLDASLPAEIVRPRAQVWPMLSSERQIPGWDGKDRSGGKLFGGFEMQWLGEAQTGTKQKGKLTLLTMKARKGAIFCQISNELAQDGMGFAQQLERALIGSVGFGLDQAFFWGDGVAKPAGALTGANPALITVDKESSQTAATINIENLSNMYARLAPGCYRNAVWMINQTAVPQLLQLYASAISGSHAGSFVPVLNESNGTFSIFGVPCVFTEHMAALGSLGDIALVDWTQYAVGLRKEVSLDKSNAPGWTEDMSDYRVIVRVDGMSTWKDVITPLNGDTQSWCVTLAERS